MTITSSTMLPLGSKAIDFSLINTINEEVLSLNDLKSDTATVIMFLSNHCPYVKHIIRSIVDMANDYIPQKISFIAISANDVIQYPEDAPEKMRALALELDFPFAYLYDESQEIARQYQAACTPDFYIFDKGLTCVYRGQLDGSRPGNNIPNDAIDIRNALDNILKNLPINVDQIPSMGCNIKWK